MAKLGFPTHIFNRYLPNEKTPFTDNSRVEPTISLMEKLSFSLKLFSVNFYGQTLIMTVRDPPYFKLALDDEKH